MDTLGSFEDVLGFFSDTQGSFAGVCIWAKIDAHIDGDGISQCVELFSRHTRLWCEYLWLFCGYMGLFCGYEGMFCGYVPVSIETTTSMAM